MEGLVTSLQCLLVSVVMPTHPSNAPLLPSRAASSPGLGAFRLPPRVMLSIASMASTGTPFASPTSSPSSDSVSPFAAGAGELSSSPCNSRLVAWSPQQGSPIPHLYARTRSSVQQSSTTASSGQTCFTALLIGVAAQLSSWLPLADLLSLSVTSKRCLFLAFYASPRDGRLVIRKPPGPAGHENDHGPNSTDEEDEAPSPPPPPELLRRVLAVPSVCVADRRTLPAVLTTLRGGVWSRVRSVSLAGVGMSDADLSSLASVLASGVLPSLTGLDLRRNIFSDGAVSTLASVALGSGACPCLSSLDLGANGFGPETCGLRSLIRALAAREDSGCCSPLARLALGSWQWGRPPVPELLRRLLSVCGEDVEELELLDGVSLMTAELRALASFLCQARPLRLRALRLSVRDEDGGKGAALLVSALRSGAATNLEVLSLRRCQVTAGGGRSLLVDALVGGALWKLQDLCLAQAGLTSEDLCHVMPALINAGAGVCGGLRVLCLEGNPDIGADGAAALADVLSDGACPGLEVLSLDGSSIGDAGVRALVLAMEAGAPFANSLRALRLSDCGLGPEALRDLAVVALARHACPVLEELGCSFNGGIGDTGVAALARALMLPDTSPSPPTRLARSLTDEWVDGFGNWSPPRHRRPVLQVLDLRCTNMGAASTRSLGLVVQAGALPLLRELSLMQGPTRPFCPETSRAIETVRSAIANNATNNAHEFAPRTAAVLSRASSW